MMEHDTAPVMFNQTFQKAMQEIQFLNLLSKPPWHMCMCKFYFIIISLLVLIQASHLPNIIYALDPKAHHFLYSIFNQKDNVFCKNEL